MLSSPDTERTRLFVVTEAEVKTDGPQEDSIVQEYIFSYLKEKVPDLPRTIFELDTFDHEAGLLSTERIKTDALDIWSGRLNEPDTTIPGRSWSVELTVGEIEGKKFFGSRLSCFSRHLDFDFDPAVPRVYRDLISKNILFADGIKLARAPIDISTDEDVEWLVALIDNPKRRRNVIALSCDAYGTCFANPDFFAHRLCGVAHVVRVYPNASFKLSDLIGKYLSIFDLGIRIYKTTPQIETDDPLRHTLYTRHALAKMELRRVQHSILADAFRTSVEGALKIQAIPTFARIRSAKAGLELAALQDAVGSQEVASLERQLKASQEARLAADAQAREALDLALQEETTRKEAEDERNQEKARAMVLAARVRALEARLGAVANANAARPDSYDEVAVWVENEFAGRMKLHRRALRGLTDAEYEDIGLVCDLLELLALEYVDAKRGNRDAWTRFEDGITSRGVEYSKSISETRAGEQGEEYFVRYKGERKFLEWHLKKGTSRDTKRDLRIYFFWDDEDEEVTIGFLPSHLDTRIT